MSEHLALSHGHKAPATIDKCLENSCLAGAGRYPKMLLQYVARDMARHLPAAVRQHENYASTVRRNTGAKFNCFHD